MAFTITPVSAKLPTRNRIISACTGEIPVEYPSSWYNAHPASLITINYYPNMTAGQVYSILSQLRVNNLWNDVLVSTFIKTVIEENIEWFSSTTLSAPWTINGVNIGEIGARLTPLNLAHWDPVEKPETLIVNENSQGVLLSRRSAFLAIIALYRKILAKESAGEYGTEISTKINNSFKNQPLNMNIADTTNFQGYETQDKLTENYKKCISIIDQFFNKFPNHDKSMIRMSTIPTRYRGCAALTSYGEVSIRMGILPQEMAALILTDAVALDFDKINKENETADDITGYFPYQLELQLVKKSAYSAANCPSLYLWLHTIGCMLNIQRSIKALVPRTVPDQMSTITSAIAIGMQYVSGGNFSIQFVGSEEVKNAITAQTEHQSEVLRLRSEISAIEEAHDAEASDEDGDDDEEEGHRLLTDQERERLEELKINLELAQAALLESTQMTNDILQPSERKARQALKYLEENNGISPSDKRELAKKFRPFASEGKGRVGKLLSELFPSIN